MLAVVLAFTPHIVLWILPAVLPMMAAPLLIAFGSRSRKSGHPLLFTTPLEREPSPVMIERERILAAWRQESTTAPVHAVIMEATSHVGA
jgi:membrane glycosyltransferase